MEVIKYTSKIIISPAILYLKLFNMNRFNQNMYITSPSPSPDQLEEHRGVIPILHHFLPDQVHNPHPDQNQYHHCNHNNIPDLRIRIHIHPQFPFFSIWRNNQFAIGDNRCPALNLVFSDVTYCEILDVIVGSSESLADEWELEGSVGELGELGGEGDFGVAFEGGDAPLEGGTEDRDELVVARVHGERERFDEE